MTEIVHCPLCAGVELRPFHRDRRRSYLRCDRCELVHVPGEYLLSPQRERAEYDLHQNDIDDPGYREFLSRLAAPLLRRLPADSRGLDFGCGPGPALAHMLREAGQQVRLYDPFYAPDPAALEARYDFICATEVVEHLYRPGEELQRLWNLLVPGGWLAIMTKLVLGPEQFSRWHYKNDPTHVCFFSRGSWLWWGRCRGVEPEFIGADVIFLRKPCPDQPPRA